jgi:hypothetical protein
VACATKNAKGNKCQTGHRHNGTAITHSRPELRSHVAFWPISTFATLQRHV